MFIYSLPQEDVVRRGEEYGSGSALMGRGLRRNIYNVGVNGSRQLLKILPDKGMQVRPSGANKEKEGIFDGSQRIDDFGSGNHCGIPCHHGPGGGLFRQADPEHKGLLCSGPVLWADGADGHRLRDDHRRQRSDGPGRCGLYRRLQGGPYRNSIPSGNVHFFRHRREDLGYRDAVRDHLYPGAV